MARANLDTTASAIISGLDLTSKTALDAKLAEHDTALDKLDLNVADAAVSPASTQARALMIIPILLADVATATTIYKTADKIEIIDVVAIKDGAGAANTVQLTDSADVAITNALAFAVDKTVTRAGTIDVAKRVVAAGGTFKVINTRAAGSAAGTLLVYAIKRA